MLYEFANIIDSMHNRMLEALQEKEVQLITKSKVNEFSAILLTRTVRLFSLITCGG